VAPAGIPRVEPTHEARRDPPSANPPSVKPPEVRPRAVPVDFPKPDVLKTDAPGATTAAKK
jgi:hypothetical protein